MNRPRVLMPANRLMIVVGLMLAGLVGWAVYRFWDGISDRTTAVHDSVFLYLGVGTIPTVLWLVFFISVMRYRSHWLKRTNLWVASVVGLTAFLGLLSFFSADDGLISHFTVEGEVRLGGEIGHILSGRVGEAFGGVPIWVATARVLLVATAAALIAFPRIARRIAVGLTLSLIYLYVMVMVGLKTAFSSIVRFYRYHPAFADVVSGKGNGKTSLLRPVKGKVEAVISESTSVSGPMPPLMQDKGSSANVLPERLHSGIDGDHTYSAKREPEEGPLLSLTNVNGSSELVVDNQKDHLASSVNSTDIKGSDESSNLERQESRFEEVGSLVKEWERPTTELLHAAPEGGISEVEIRETADTIQRTLQEYGVEVEVGQVSPGPAVTMYGLVPGWVRRYRQVKEKTEDGTPKLDVNRKQIIRRVETKTRVKVDSIIQREKDLALALKTPSIRIETPVMGQSLLGIEVPNPNFGLVTLRSVMESDEFERLRIKAQLPVALGKGSGGETVVVDLAKMPHLLIAGATGSGKSVCINSIVSCLIMERSPAELRMLLIDPKRVELTPYNGVPHLLTPVVVETDEVVGLLKGLIKEMMDRYRRLEEVGARNIQAYHEKASDKMPFLVVAVDELADLMMTASFEVEQSLCRLAQLGRATGIHLVVATQRPSVDVLTGLIKANFPSRISFGVTSQIDSRTILDTAGADKLLGRGDMLYQPIDASRPERVQGVFISDSEVEDLVSFWRSVPEGPLPEVPLHVVGDGEGADSDSRAARDGQDEMMARALELTHNYSKLSTSLLQRRLRIGYPRAARLMDQLEDAGVVGPSDGSKSRDVIIMPR